MLLCHFQLINEGGHDTNQTSRITKDILLCDGLLINFTDINFILFRPLCD